MTNTATGLAPLVESRSTEEQLATPAGLLGGNRPRCREPPERIPMETQVLRRLSGVKPLVSLIGAGVLEARSDCRRHTIDETVDQQVDRRVAVIAWVTQPTSSISEPQPCCIRSRVGLTPICSNLEQPSR